ncbi:hypothetical protein ACFVXH_39725 [Kitasatospora sp. NPDC058184]|uniref:hypothetical protein n=1 Tax=Kitasatospora sp. NPDC058184 TaxID=3346370 RepID=UPI0036DBD760
MSIPPQPGDSGKFEKPAAPVPPAAAPRRQTNVTKNSSRSLFPMNVTINAPTSASATAGSAASSSAAADASSSSGGSGGDSSNLARLVQQLEKVEFVTDRDLFTYAKLLRRIGLELHMRIGMDADVVAAVLSQYKGRWFLFGLDSKGRGKLVGAHLRAGSAAAKILGLAGVKMYASFVKHFVKPEVEAAQAAKRNQGRGGRGFSIGDDANLRGPGRPGEAGGRF